jgi:hypothetical protein
MRFGSKVIVTRGGGLAPGTPGCRREVRGVLIGAKGCERIVRLTEEDPLATCNYCLHVGDVGYWGSSVVRPDINS